MPTPFYRLTQRAWIIAYDWVEWYKQCAPHQRTPENDRIAYRHARAMRYMIFRNRNLPYTQAG
jgi:hypothetical protein